ncbi:MAG TPA: ubiquinone biosynthesis protein UbiB [Oxalobacteraceae bacterium]|nr:ubiquinone biosynthesis protein UbiB [Oxalobacteraceae bacterium]
MLAQTLFSMRDLGRLYDIVAVLIRYGFGDMVRRLGLADALERAGKVLRWGDARALANLPAPVRVRLMLEELGPTFIKLGQVLSSRVDLLEPEWIAELGKLQDSATPVPYEAIRQQLTEDLGAPPEEAFAYFDPVPLATASMAQVYRARLQEGDEVVVKVRRPGIRPIIETDLRWMMRLAQLAEAESRDLRAFNPQQVVRQFGLSLRNELDFAVECRNATLIAENFAGYIDADSLPRNFTEDPETIGVAVADAADASDAADFVPPIIIPKIYWAWSGERVCVQEFIDGIPGRHLHEADRVGLDRKVLARRGAHAVLKMILDDGFFHADPHPGNVFYLPDNRIAFIDFGMVGRINQRRREEVTQMLFGLVRREPERVADILLDWTGNAVVDEEGLIGEIQTFVERYSGVPLKQLKLGEMLSDMLALMRQHHVTLPPDLSLLVKAFISLEGMGRELDPGFDMASEALPILERLMREQYAPAAVLKRGWGALREALSLAAGLPHDLSRLLRAARRGRVEIHIDAPNLRRVGNQLDRALNRMVVGIVIAALIIGSSIVMTVPGGPSLLGLPFFGLLGFLSAVAGSVWLVLSIWKSHRQDRNPDD